MTENFEDKLQQAECKLLKGAKNCASIRKELECEKCSKTFCQKFTRQNMQSQTNTKHSINSEDIFKSTKNVLEKSSTLKVLQKFMVGSVELNSSGKKFKVPIQLFHG